MADIDKKNNFIQRQIVETAALLTAYQELLELREEWDALGYGTAIEAEDILPPNDHLTPEMLADAFTSVDAIKAVMNAGHKTNLYKLVP